MSTLMNDIAIVGIACRFPGCDNIEEFWELLKAGENHVQEIPEDRWKKEAFYDADPDAPGKSYTNRAATLENIYDWDNKLFDVNKFEAEPMDPQHKLALEVTYRALENAGIQPSKMKGTKSAVYMGQMNDDYAKLTSIDTAFVDNYSASGTAASILANRISYTFDLHGPSVTLDTACSSALVGIHLGIQSILSGESDMAVCGGVNLILSPGPFIALSKAQMASKKGQSHAFAKEADGYTRGEGCGIVILKALDQAKIDNNKIWGCITSGCNSDGRASIPISNPSFDMQKQLIESTVAKSGLQKSDIQYVEMHGTGTPVGDPIETSAVGQSIGKARKQKKLPMLKIGSVKTNIGHLESAAGVAGLIKLLLMMDNGQHVPSLFGDNPSDTINFEDLHLSVSRNVEPFPICTGKRIASVNSFGFGGTNVHAIIQQSDQIGKLQSGSMPFAILCFSGKSDRSVIISINDTLAAINKGYVSNIEDLALVSSIHRDHYSQRVGIVCKPTLEDAKLVLEKYVGSDNPILKIKNRNLGNKIIFVFCGMGTHWLNMGLEFYKTVPLFKKVIDEIDKQLLLLSGFSIQQCLQGIKNLDEPQYGSPATFAIQVATVEMLKYYGVSPDVILGHSVGEVAAAYASNHLSLESAVKLIFHRSNLLHKVKGGGMLVIGNVPNTEVENYIKENNFTHQVSIAAYNSPMSCTVSGELDTLTKLEDILRKRHPEKGLFLRNLKVKVAYHSKFMDPILTELQQNLKQNLTGKAGHKTIRHISTVTGTIMPPSEFLNEKYWAKNMRQPVFFAKALSLALDEKNNNFIVEIGPRPALSSYIKTLGQGHHVMLFSCMRPEKCNDQFFPTMAKIYESGGNLQYISRDILPANYPRYGFHRVPLSKYTPKMIDFLSGNEASTLLKHPFIIKDFQKGQKCSISKINRQTSAFVFDHVVGEATVVPGSTYVEMAAVTCFTFAPEVFSRGNCLMININFRRPCVLMEGRNKASVKTTLFDISHSVEQTHGGEWEFDITTEDILHAEGKISINSSSVKQKSESIYKIRSRCDTYFQRNDLYNQLKRLNFSHGPMLQCVTSGQRNNLEVLANVQVSDDQFGNYLIHPVLLDCMLQLCVLFPKSQELGKMDQIIPYGIEEVIITSIPPRESMVYITTSEQTNSAVKVDGYIMSNTGQIHVKCKGMKFGVMGSEAAVNPRDVMYHLNWNTLDFNKEEVPLKDKKYLLLSNYTSNEIQLFKDANLADRCVQLNKEDGIYEDDDFDDVLTNDGNNLTDILYAFCCGEEINDESDGAVVNHMVLARCYSLLQLIKIVESKYSHMCITVLTRNVHNVIEGLLKHNENGMDGLIGYTLWGMMRTVIMENVYQNYRTVDLSVLDTMNLGILRKVLQQTSYGMEIVISEGNVKYCSFDEISENKMNSRKLMNVPTGYDVTVYTEMVGDNDTYDFECDTFRNLSHIIEEKRDPIKNKCSVEFESMYVLKTSAQFDTFPERGNVRSFMSIGGKGSFQKKQVHTVYALQVCSSNLVHEKCTFPTELLPTSTPSATIWFLAWNFCSEAKQHMAKGKCCQILANKSGEVLSRTIHYVSSVMKYNFADHHEGCNVFVVANDVKDMRLQLEEYDNTIHSVTVFTWKNSSGKAIREYVLKHSPQYEKYITIVSAEDVLLNDLSLGNKVQMFKKWLSKVNKTDLKIWIEELDTILQKQGEYNLLILDRDIELTGDIIVKFRNKTDDKMIAMASKDVLYRTNGSYMIFGGSKGLGWEIVCHLAKRGAGKIGIVSRSGLTAEKQKHVSELEKQYGCKFVVLTGDVTKIDDVGHLFKAFETSLPRNELKGIFMGTVVTEDATIANMTRSKFENVLKPKVMGIWNVHHFTKESNLDFFIAHSSIASMFGNPGQTNYSAANAFLDVFMCYRKQKFQVGQSICWGALDLGMLEDNQGKKKILSNLGMLTMNTEEILTSLDHCLIYDPAMVCFSKINWKNLIKNVINTPKRNTLKHLLWRKGHFVKPPKTYEKYKHLSNSSIDSFLRAMFATVLMLDEDEIQPDTTMEMLGADSHQANIVYSTLTAEFGELPNITRLGVTTMTIEEMYKAIDGNSSTKVEPSKADLKPIASEITPETASQGMEKLDVKEKNANVEVVTMANLEESSQNERGDVKDGNEVEILTVQGMVEKESSSCHIEIGLVKTVGEDPICTVTDKGSSEPRILYKEGIVDISYMKQGESHAMVLVEHNDNKIVLLSSNEDEITNMVEQMKVAFNLTNVEENGHATMNNDAIVEDAEKKSDMENKSKTCTLL